MTMQGFWFGVIAVLWAVFFLLEGFDFGVGILLPYVAHDESDKHIALRSIGPTWDGNEVWLIVAGGATFAAFPEWYATAFSGFYLPFALLLAGLILRGIGIEYRERSDTARGRAWCDGAITVGSFLAAVLLGVAFANFVRGVDLDSHHNMTNSFLSLLNPYALLGGVVTLTLFVFHGGLFLALRTIGPVRERAGQAATVIGPVTAMAGLGFFIWTTQIRGGWVSIVFGIVVVLSVVAAIMAHYRAREGLAFAATALATLLVPIWLFAALWPDVLPARNDPALSLTVQAASSSPYTLKVMAIVALIFTPMVLIYQGWSYWVFRGRVSDATPGGYGQAVGRTVSRARDSARHMLGTGAAERSQPSPPPPT
jgi:cytochrome d ubiquinol oxidase subunit II